jgi:CRISPR system Cascade subunit CasB
MAEIVSDIRITDFCQKLARLDAGERARLKRNAGRTLAQSRQVVGLFLNQLMPRDVPRYYEDTYFLVATLYPLNPEAGGSGSLGTALRRARESESLDRRVEVLLDADATHLPFRLRQLVRYLYSKRVPIHWPVLLRHLLAWNSDKRWVQERWAHDYFVGDGSTPNES